MTDKANATTLVASSDIISDEPPSRVNSFLARHRVARWLPWLVLCVGLVVTALLWTNERNSERRILQTHFDSLVRQTDVLITERMDVYEQVLRGAQGLFAASGTVSRKEFHDYVRGLHLEDHYSGIQGVGFSLLVPASQKSRHVDNIRSQGYPDFSILPEGERDLYTSVIYLEPFNKHNAKAFGYDMYSDNIAPRVGDSSQGLRHIAMAQARDSGKAAVSGKVKLLMEIDSKVQAGILMYMPVYKNDTPMNAIEKRRSNLLGWVYAPFRMDDLMSEIIGERRKDIEIKIYDGIEPRKNTLMYTLGDWDARLSPDRHFETNRHLTIAGRDWNVAIRSVPGFGAELVANRSQIIAITGFIGSVLFALLTWVLTGSRMRAMLSEVEMRRELDERKKVQLALYESEVFSRATIDAISAHICVIDATGQVLAVNAAWHNCDDACCPAFGCDVGDNYLSECEFIFGDDEIKLANILSGIEAVMAGREREFGFEFVTHMPTAMATSMPTSKPTMPSTFAVRVSPFQGDSHKIVVVQEDISERKRGEEWMALAGSVFDNVIEAITVTDANCNIVAVNPAFTQITGYSAAEVIGQNPRMLQSGRHDRSFYNEMWLSLNTRGKWQGEISNKGKNGALIAEWLSISAIMGTDGVVERYVAVFSDITEKKKMEKLVWDQANFDALTALPNRHLFLDRLTMEIRKSELHTQFFGMFFIDLDNFKDVNETLGHPIGDMLLIHAAQRIASCLRASDTVGRLGGDEFAVLLPDVSDPAKIEFIVQEVLDRLAEPFLIADERVYLTASIGITLYPTDALHPGDLFKNADQALYVAKNAGRNRFSYFTKTMEASAKIRLQTINDLRCAIERDQLKVYFQPIIDLTNHKVIKAEALLRWFHPQRGMISPAEFIPIAEESGLINEIGDWVFKESALWAQRWSKHIGQTFQISVNKSPVQFHTKSRCTSWTEYLQMLGLPGKCISVEITEGLLLNAESSVDAQLQEYSNAGIHISIDDFGTGYSSMSYLKKFHIDYLKIDQSFVRDMENNETDRAIAEAIIVMAHKLGCKVIAEGIEPMGRGGCYLKQVATMVRGICSLKQFLLPSLNLSSFTKQAPSVFCNHLRQTCEDKHGSFAPSN